MKIDWNDSKNKGQTFTLLPEGRYDIICEKAETGITSTGKEQIVATFNILGPIGTGKKLFDNFIEGALWKLFTFLDAAGASHLTTGVIDGSKIVKEMVGLRVSVFVTPGKTPAGKDRHVLSNYAGSTIINIKNDSEDIPF